MSMYTRQEVIAAAILAIANDAFTDGLLLGRATSNVVPIREVGRRVHYDDLPDISTAAMVSAVAAIPAFVLKLKESPKRADFMAAAEALMKLEGA